MDARTFLRENQQALTDYVFLSRTGGSRSDYVQGGGGNTSCKFDDHLMAIKASGFRLNQIAMENGYAVLDYVAIRRFYADNRPESLADVEAAGSAAAKSSVQTIDGLPVLRPSVEAGFHSLLHRFVLHSHSIYANLAACSADAQQILDKVLAGQPFAWGYVPYINPGAQLTFAIAAEIERVQALRGEMPKVILMQNHGLIVSADDRQECLDLHDQVNEHFAKTYGVGFSDWPTVTVKPWIIGGEPDADNATAQEDAALFMSATEWLRDGLKGSTYSEAFFTLDALYPDQLVFLAGNLVIRETGRAANITPADLTCKCTVFRETGEVVYNCGFNEAQTIEETLCAILFVTRTIAQAGCTLVTMSESGKDFIANWESEKYRKTLTAK